MKHLNFQQQWEETRVIDRTAKNHDLKIKEVLHIQMTPENYKFNNGHTLVWSFQDAGCLCCMFNLPHKLSDP